MEIQYPKEYHSNIRALLRNQEHLWSGQIGHIYDTTNRIDVISGARMVIYAPYHAGPNAREIEQFEINIRLNDGIIES